MNTKDYDEEMIQKFDKLVEDEHFAWKVKDIMPKVLVAGEAAGGIHGTNRLMGNSLLDVIVFGRNAGKKAAAKYKDVELGEMNLDHVKAYDEELKEAGVETNEVSPMLLPHYARHERKITGEVVSA